MGPGQRLSTVDHPRWAPVLLLVGIGLFWMSLYLYVPILSPYIVHQGGSLTLVGIVVAAYGVPQFTLRIGLGTWSDRWGRRKPFLVMGFVVSTVSAVSMALWPNPWAFVGWRFLAGLSASFWAMFTMWYVSYFPGPKAVVALGWVSFANAGGQVVASLLGGIIAQDWGWHGPFWTAAGVAGLGLLMVVGVHEVPSRRGQPQPARVGVVRLLRQHRGLGVASLLGACFQFGTFVATFGYVPVFAYRMGLSRADLGLLLMASLIPTTLATVLTGSLFARRVSIRMLTVIGFVLIMAMAVVTPWVSAPWLLFVTQALMGFGRGMLGPTLMALAIEGVDGASRTTAMAVYQALYCVGMILGPVAAGWLVGSWGLASAFWLAGLSSLAGAWLAWTRWRPRPGLPAARAMSETPGTGSPGV